MLINPEGQRCVNSPILGAWVVVIEAGAAAVADQTGVSNFTTSSNITRPIVQASFVRQRVVVGLEVSVVLPDEEPLIVYRIRRDRQRRRPEESVWRAAAYCASVLTLKFV